MALYTVEVAEAVSCATGVDKMGYWLRTDHEIDCDVLAGTCAT